MSTLKLTLLQQPLVWRDPHSNMRHFARLLAGIKDRDVIVLPEMFTTGFAMVAAQDGLPEEQVLSWLQGWANHCNALIAGSVALQTAEGAVNRFLLVEPDGVVHRYDKRHLFRMANEHEYYQSGQERVVLNWRGWRILPQVCYDLRFPVWSRNQNDYDLALYVANWPAARGHHWRTLLAARAIENQAYVAGCNRVGEDDNKLHYQGDSLIINPQGENLASLAADEAGRLDADLSLADLQAYRTAFPAWQDADAFSFKV